MAIRIDYTSYPERERRAVFTEKLIPESPYRSAGVPIPECRKIAKALESDDIELNYIEDVVIKGIVIFSSKEPFSLKRKRIDAFLPHLVSWMVTDIVSSSLWYKQEEKAEVEAYFTSLLDSTDPMTARLGVVALMDRDFMREETVTAMLEKLSAIRTEHYLLSMAIAWYFATAYTYYPDITAPWFSHLDEATRRRAKQKCRDSRRISPEAKERLKSL